jgi:hypothetical protein
MVYMGKPFIDLTGQQYGLWTVTGPWQRRARPDGRGYRTMWFCTCQCGKTNWIDATNLRGRISTNCGCQRETATPKQQAARIAMGHRNRKHGYSGNDNPMRGLYHTYHAMINRCYKPKDTGYRYYGARGIKVCERWLGPDGFTTFLADMPGWKPGLSIERLDYKGNYCPENCKWIPRSQQTRNTGRNVFLPIGKNLSQYCQEEGLDYHIAWHMLHGFQNKKYISYINMLLQNYPIDKRVDSQLVDHQTPV